jgi:hypothetical protein
MVERLYNYHSAKKEPAPITRRVHIFVSAINRYLGDQREERGCFSCSFAKAANVPYFIQVAWQCLTQAGSSPFFTLAAQRSQYRVTRGAKSTLTLSGPFITTSSTLMPHMPTGKECSCLQATSQAWQPVHHSC